MFYYNYTMMGMVQFLTSILINNTVMVMVIIQVLPFPNAKCNAMENIMKGKLSFYSE